LKYRSEIDGLRALAVVPVILFHAGFELFNGGFVGVDVFFVISGYLITTILIEDIEKNRFSIINFYERRARRILPALFFVMLVTIPLAWMWMSPSQMKDFSQSLIAVSLFLSNIHFWRESGYFAAATEEKPLQHTWSLAVEEQYYVLFPIFLFLVWRFGKNRVFWMIVVFAAMSLALSEWGWRNASYANFYLAPTRAWELFAGSIAAFIVQNRGVKANNALSLLGLATIIFAIFEYDKNTPFPSIFGLVPVIGVVLLVLYADKETFVGRLLSIKLFVGIGLISYSAYLWHQPLFAFARIYSLETPSSKLMLSLSIASLLLAIVSWRFIEKPFRRKEAFLASQLKLFKFSFLGFLLFVLIGLIGHFNKGFENRFKKVLNGDISHIEFHEYVSNRYLDCEPQRVAEEAPYLEDFLRCKQTKQRSADWVLLGDSHAEHLFLGLAKSFPSKNMVFYILDGKPYLSNNKFKNIFEVLLAPQSPKKIFLTMYYAGHLKNENDLLVGFGDTIRALQRVGHEVVLLGDIPTYRSGLDVRDCLYAKSILAAKNYCSMDRIEAVKQEKIYSYTLTELSKALSVDYYPISDYLCDGTKCSMILGNTILYRDANHLNIPGSILIGKKLKEVLR
jgi:peptidoglycan/LPS O-acetylase OafA/YrhL